MPFEPKYEITADIAKHLMKIEANKEAVSTLPVTVSVLNSLRESARLLSTHYSTQIEGNRLTQEQVALVFQGSAFPNRKRDEIEVKNYFKALDYLDVLLEKKVSRINEMDIRRLHGLVMSGKKKATPYRDGQNVIKDSKTGGIVYLPPEAKDVPHLMSELFDWVNAEIKEGLLPCPLISGIAHYQFATIHPYFDGNGRTARLLTNLVLHKTGYGLKGIFSLEEYYAKNLPSYYRALEIGESHNYYEGRAERDITSWIQFFCEGMAHAFSTIRKKADAASKFSPLDQSSLLRELSQKQKRVLGMFKKKKYVTTREVAKLLGIHIRTSLNLCNKWCEEEFLVKHGSSPKERRYELGENWLILV